MISCNVTYYNEPHMLVWWYNTIKQLNEEGFDIRLNITDDGSMRQPAVDFFEKHPPTKQMRLFRVKEDIGFNSHGARNLMMRETESDWNILSDIDRTYPEDTLIDILETKDKQQGKHYSFFTPSGKSFTLNEYLIHKDDFWLSGGYDEEFVNIHWGDRLFFETSLYPVCPRVRREEWWCYYKRGARDVSYGPYATTQYPDDNTLISPENGVWTNEESRKELIQFVRQRNSTHEGRMSKKVINFEWCREF